MNHSRYLKGFSSEGDTFKIVLNFILMRVMKYYKLVYADAVQNYFLSFIHDFVF